MRRYRSHRPSWERNRACSCRSSLALAGLRLRVRHDLFLRTPGSVRAADREPVSNLQETLETGEHHRPSITDGSKHFAVGVEIVVGHCQFDLAAYRLDFEGHPRRPFATEDFMNFNFPTI